MSNPNDESSVAERFNLRRLRDFNLDKIGAKDATASRHWYLHKFLNCVFPAAMPPDVRKWLCPSEEAAHFLPGYAPNRAQEGIAQKKIGEICSGRLKTSRTSVAVAAKNIYEKLV